MRPIWRPAAAMIKSSPDRRALRPVLLAKPISLRIARTLHWLEQQVFCWRVEIDSMCQTSHLSIRASDFEMIRDDEQTIAVGSVQVRAHVEVCIVRHVSYRFVEDQLPTIQRLARFVESLHVHFQRLQAWELVVWVALFEFFPVPWDVHSCCLGEAFRSLVFQDGTVRFPEVHRSLRVEGAGLVYFERAGACKAYPFACGLGYVHDSCAV